LTGAAVAMRRRLKRCGMEWEDSRGRSLATRKVAKKKEKKKKKDGERK